MSRGTAQTLRALLAEPGPVVVVECHDALSARIVERRGYAATYLGGSTVAALSAAIPDHGLISTREMLECVSRITAAIDIPLIVDADQGGETNLTVHRAIRDFEHAGAAGVHIEDTVNPKHMHGGPNTLVTLKTIQARIAAAVAARRSDDFLIIGRTDERVNRGSIEETVRRGQAMAAEGADIFMAPGLGSLKDMGEVVRSVPIPVLDINVPVERAQASGLAIDLFAGVSLPGLMRAQHELIDAIETHGRLPGALLLEPDGLAELLDDDVYRTLAATWVNTIEPTQPGRARP